MFFKCSHFLLRQTYLLSRTNWVLQHHYRFEKVIRKNLSPQKVHANHRKKSTPHMWTQPSAVCHSKDFTPILKASQHDMRPQSFPRGRSPSPQHINTIEWGIMGSDHTTSEPNRKVNSKSLVQNSQESPHTRSHVHYKITQISYRLIYLQSHIAACEVSWGQWCFLIRYDC